MTSRVCVPAWAGSSRWGSHQERHGPRQMGFLPKLPFGPKLDAPTRANHRDDWSRQGESLAESKWVTIFMTIFILKFLLIHKKRKTFTNMQMRSHIAFPHRFIATSGCGWPRCRAISFRFRSSRTEARWRSNPRGVLRRICCKPTRQEATTSSYPVRGWVRERGGGGGGEVVLEVSLKKNLI